MKELPEDLLLTGYSRHVFLQPDLLKIWLDTYKPLRKQNPIFIKGVSANNEAFIPLVVWKRNWKNAFLNTLVAAGNSDYDYHNPVFLNLPNRNEIDSFWTGLLNYLTSNFKFDTLRINGITDEFVSQKLTWATEEICPALDLSNLHSENDLFAFLKTSLRGDIRRQIRRLNEIGELSFVRYTNRKDITSSTFTDFLNQHSKRWPNSYKAPYFHENLLKKGLETGLVDFSVLKCGDKEIAWHLGFKYDKKYYYYMPAGNVDFAQFSPVKVHLFFLIKDAIEQGFDLFDHLRGDENYKAGWSNTSQNVHIFNWDSPKFTSRLKRSLLKLRHRFL